MTDWPTLLPLVFAGLMGLAILIYVILDGFDLGIGILFAAADGEEKDAMIAAVGPFWDANETWLVLAVGLLLVAFPIAHGIILTALYLPVFMLLIGLEAKTTSEFSGVETNVPMRPRGRPSATWTCSCGW